MQVIGPTQGESQTLQESPHLTHWVIWDIMCYCPDAGNCAYTGGVLPQDSPYLTHMVICNTLTGVIVLMQAIGPTQGESQNIHNKSPYSSPIGYLGYTINCCCPNAGNWANTGGVLSQDEAQGPKQGIADSSGKPGLAWAEADTSTLRGSGGARPSSPDLLWRPCLAGCISRRQRYSTHAKSTAHMLQMQHMC